MPPGPEDKARAEIDRLLVAAGWVIQNKDELDLTAGRGVAVREFVMKPGFGFADYCSMLIARRRARLRPSPRAR
jgi:type I restriction enzyme R subunit